MKNCQLCLRALADKTGSHIIPFFLIKTMVSEEGTKGRDREISFKIESTSTDTYIGRSVSIDSITEVLGREPAESDFEHNSNHYTEDHILCSVCEKRLAIIESCYASKRIHQSDNSLAYKNIKSELSILFWASIVWRISITAFPGPKLQHKEQRKLRNILDTCLGSSIEETDVKTTMHISLLQEIRTIVLYEPPNTEPTAKTYFANPISRFPYSYMINDYTLFFYFKESHLTALKQSFFGLEKFQQPELANTVSTANELIYKITEKDAKGARERMARNKANERIYKIEKTISSTIKHFYPMLHPLTHHRIINDTMNELIENEHISMLGLDNKILVNSLFSSIKKYIK